MSKRNKMNPSFLSENNNLAVHGALYSFRKRLSLSEKALFILLWFFVRNQFDQMVATTDIGQAIGEDNRSNLWKAIQQIKDAEILKTDKTEREGSRNVRRISIDSENEHIKSLLSIIE